VGIIEDDKKYRQPFCNFAVNITVSL